MYDLVIRNGRILDGTSNPWFRADIGIIGDKIAKIGTIDGDESKETIEAAGFYVVPGFIDPHTHSDYTIIQEPCAYSKIFQGVTTEIGGNCGFSVAPINPDTLNEAKEYVSFMPGSLSWNWKRLRDYFAILEKTGISNNFGSLIGHGFLRLAVMGFKNSQPATSEIDGMKILLREGLNDGAKGLSFGLAYPPGQFAQNEELIEFARIVKEFHGKLLTFHLRSEGDAVVESIREAIQIGRTVDLPVHISHLKCTGPHNWQKIDEIFSIIEKARKDGIDVTFDIYPYIASSTTLTSLIPAWAMEGGIRGMLERIQDSVTWKKIIPAIEREKDLIGGWEKIMISGVRVEENKKFEGKTVREIAEMEGYSEIEVILNLLMKERGAIFAIFFNMSEEIQDMIMKHPCAMIGSDGKILSTQGVLSEGKPHPRNFGAFPRVIARSVRERRILGLSEAIRKMTSFPARRFGINYRGLLKEGIFADIVIFDFECVNDLATFSDPKQYPVGIEYVIVNGRITVYRGNHTGIRAGIIIR